MTAPHVPGPAGPVWGRRVGWFLARGVWATEVVGRDRVPTDGPVVLAANHTGVIDGPILVGVAPRPTHVLVKEEMFAGPLGTILRAAGQIPVDRSSGRSALASALGVLQRGGAVGVFPEGNRGRGDVAGARAGVAWLAVNGDAPVVPVAVLGTRRTGESVSRVPGVRRHLVVEFGEPLVIERPEGASRRDLTALAAEQIRAAMSALVAEAAHRTGLTLPHD
ncbi:MAG TPA: lysophospholipid acyltransferase family protein [Cellulomonas sp.]